MTGAGALWRAVLAQENRADPHLLMAELRDRGAVQAGEVFLLSGYDEVARALVDPRLTTDRRLQSGFPEDAPYMPFFAALEEPAHGRLRTRTMRHFGPPRSPGSLPR